MDHGYTGVEAIENFYAAQRRLTVISMGIGVLFLVLAMIMFGLHRRAAWYWYWGYKISRRYIYAAFSLLAFSTFIMLVASLLVLLNINKAEREEGYGTAPPAVVYPANNAPLQPMPAPPQQQQAMYRDAEYTTAPTSQSQPGSGRPSADNNEVHVQFPQK
ncbi:hypothetical protein IWQ60_002441 [Tieghemiomyces parasiticus]|uniref:Uncharacterized protein n=1 Tax=Tieghemiomyces parasiticus TaxID=78921 RepID=A0A9W8AHH2_9FUNG|nr:hypothetical protein IWQ60_002441 [Tieghemiomyces parasiticus]